MDGTWGSVMLGLWFTAYLFSLAALWVEYRAGWREIVACRLKHGLCFGQIWHGTPASPLNGSMTLCSLTLTFLLSKMGTIRPTS